MKVDKSILLIIVFAIVTGKVYSQQHFSLETCRQLAIDNNKTLKIASEEEQIAYYEKREALTKYFPDLSFSGGYMRNQKNIRLLNPASIPSVTPPITLPIPPSGITMPEQDISELRDKLLDLTELETKNMWELGVHLTQPIFAGGKIIALNDIRSYAQQLAGNAKDYKTIDILVEVDQAYWQVVSLANKNNLAQAYVELLEKMDTDIFAMEQEGVATKADRLSVNVKLNEAQITLTKARNGLSLSKMLLSQICGLDVNDQLILKDENVQSLSIDEDTNETYNVSEAIANRIELKSIDLAAKIYQKQEIIARAEYLPTIGLQAGYAWTNPNSYNGFQNRLGGMWNVGVGVSVPLNFVSSASKLSVAKAHTRIKKWEMEEAKEKIALQVSQESYKLSEAKKKMLATKKNSEKADENLMYANTGFEEGVITASDALAAHTAWLAAHVEMIDAQIDLKLCKIYLDKALGRGHIH